ncbi:hypothetical protein Asp14428_03210 [Actinoplanes sp. NBRC 14428]|nr:hypothetical protein Asp14428_03210 [Actinoplanes sp. NBRC 14428]
MAVSFAFPRYANVDPLTPSVTFDARRETATLACTLVPAYVSFPAQLIVYVFVPPTGGLSRTVHAPAASEVTDGSVRVPARSLRVTVSVPAPPTACR